MKLLDLITRTPVSEALGWTLFHSLWQGAAVAAAFAMLLALVRSPRIRYAAGCAALLAMLASFVITLIYFLPDTDNGARILVTPVLPPWRELTDGAVNSGLLRDFSAVIPWLAPFWLLGVCVFYLRYAAGWFSLIKLRRRGTCDAPAEWQRRLAELARELGISRPVTLVESLLTEAPVVLGHFRPSILVPLSFLSGLPPQYIEAILLHELAHVRRADYLVNICQRVVEGFLFYHPAAWWISRVVRAERENCCDDEVIAFRGDAHEYALALAALEQNRSQVNGAELEAAVAATGGNLMKRIHRLLYPKPPSGIWAPTLAATVLMAGCAMTLGAWQAGPLASPQADAALESPWQKWLNEDVVYIISDQEKAAFERLHTDEERQMFVNQFWARRDPTPGNADNEFKEQHYRRIAFANKHFRTASGTPGWRTDRGHMYIVYGPPDEIDSHPKTTAANGIEQWRYGHVEGLGDNRFFTFVDKAGAGDFRLAPGSGQ
jgi:GWxTD domain-containing protein